MVDTIQNLRMLAVSSLAPSELLQASLPLVGAIVIFVIGWLIAIVASGITDKILRRLKVDSYLANSVGVYSQRFNIRQIGKTLVFWIILLFALVAALNALNLTTVSAPLNSFLNQIFGYLPSLGAALALVVVAWMMATVAKLLVLRTADSFGLDDKLGSLEAEPEDHAHTSRLDSDLDRDLGSHSDSSHSSKSTSLQLSRALGNVVYGFVFLFFLPLILGVLQLQGPLAPIQNLLNDFLSALPSVFKAVVIAAIGWFIARLLRDVVSNLLVAVGADRLNPSMGVQSPEGAPTLSRLGGMLTFILVLIPTATAALDALAIPAISSPATAMLNQILSALPLIFTAVAILGIAYVIGKYLASLVTGLLDGVGFNSFFRSIGIEPPLASGNTPSRIVGMICHIALMMVATVAATNILNIPGLTTIITGMMVVLGQVLVGLVILAFGLYLANLAKMIISSSGSAQSKLLGQMARVAILGLVMAMALQQMGIAANIVTLSFGLLLGSMALALAIAFGLGGRDVAARHLDGWVDQFKGLNVSSAPSNSSATQSTPSNSSDRQDLGLV
jgi:Conserved TM helix